ncbi:hypothetical protein YC2023_079071 [Brassica napus]
MKFRMVLMTAQIQECTVETTLSIAPGEDPTESLLSSKGTNLRTETLRTYGSVEYILPASLWTQALASLMLELSVKLDGLPT